MSKKKTRDDFSLDTKRRAADRVNCFCSMCGQITKAASAESSKSVSNLGVAAHICAAASGGKRYDSAMTSAERSDIKNCIWLCKHHADLIDTDEVLYPKEYLHEKKTAMENLVARALANKETKLQIIISSGFGIEKTMEILQEKIANGDFLELKQLLDSMEISADSNDLADLRDYFEIVHAFYCNRIILDTKIEEYKKRKTKNYINQICELFAQHFEAVYLSKVIDLCLSEDTKKIATHVINDTVEGGIITRQTEKIGEEELQKIKLISKGSLLHKLGSNFAIQKGIYTIQNADGSEIGFYTDEFVYKQKKLVFELALKAVKNLNLKEQRIEVFKEYNVVLASLDKIKILAPELQSFYFARLLLIASNLKDRQAFERLYAECNTEVRENLEIKEIVLHERIQRGAIKVDFAEVKKFCEAIGSYALANTYLNEMMEENPIEAEKIINAHQFLFSVNSVFLKTNIRLKKEIRKSANFSAINFLAGYKDSYKCDPAFHIYMAFYSHPKKNKAIFEKEVQWLDKNVNYANGKIELNNLSMLIAVHQRAERYDKMLELDALALPNYFRLLIASALQNSKRMENIKHAKRIYLEVLEQEPTMEGLCRSLSGCCYSIGEMQEAKDFIIKEIKLCGKKEDYLNLMRLRYETNDTAIDEHIEKAKELQDHTIDHLIGGFYLENDLRKEAKQFLIRSLLVDEKNTFCMNGYVSAVLGTKMTDQPKKIGVGVTAQLIDGNGMTVLVAIHDGASFPNNSPNKFAQCNHHKENDRAVDDLIMAKTGDEIVYKGTTYKIGALNWNEITFHKFIIGKLIEHKKLIQIQGETSEQLIEKLTEFLREKTKHNADIIKKYNESEKAWPTILLAKFAGKGYLATYSFLFYENTKKFRNLNSVYVLPEKPQFVLSFETIYALAIFDIDEKKLNHKNCFIPLSVKRKMTKEVDEMIARNKSENAAGQAMMVNNKMALDVPDDDRRKANIKFFHRLKRLLEEIPTAEKEYSYIHENELKKAFAELKMFIESDTLGCAQSNADRVLVVDDPFLSAVIISDQTNAIGLNRFLAVLDLDVVEHLECVKQLARMNFGNYFTLDVYEHMKKKVLEEKDRKVQVKLVEELYKFFTAEFIDVTAQPNLWKHHNLVIHDIGVQKRLFLADEGDEFDSILLKATVHNFSKEHPEEFKRRQEDLARRFRSQLIQKDSKTYIQTWLEPENQEDI